MDPYAVGGMNGGMMDGGLGGDAFGGPPMGGGEMGMGGGMGGMPPTVGMMGGGEPNQLPRKHHGWNGHFVFWGLGPKLHNLIIYGLLGISFFMLFLVVLGCPQIKEIYFISGKLEGDVGQINLGWLGACIYDTSSGWNTCTMPSYPLNVGDFGDVQGRLEKVADTFGSGAKTRSLAFNVGSAILTLLAVVMHRAGRNRGPFYFTCAAALVTWVAFFVDLGIFMSGQSSMSNATGLEPAFGLAMLFAGLACPAETIAVFFSYSRSVKAQTNWPHADPEKKPGGAVGGAETGMGAPMDMGGPPMGGDPMMGNDMGGGMPMDNGMGGGSMMGPPGGAPPPF